MPRYSILIPAYNVEPYVDECLSSVLRQSIHDLEVVIVDDGSTDATARIIAQRAAQDSRIIHITHDHNKGRHCARKTAVEAANGERILFLDADDTLEPNLLEILDGYTEGKSFDMVRYGVSVIPRTPQDESFTLSYERMFNATAGDLQDADIVKASFSDVVIVREGDVCAACRIQSGISKAQNAGLDAARGAYIAFADNDDILDRHNIQYLLHALQTTGADMSKARWQQFGVSQLDTITTKARRGADAPRHITVFTNPLRAYQTVFCKSLRLIGTLLGRNTEARYFNEANWCRLYRRELWDSIRFPEGMYAQDVMVAGKLYSRMNKVADIDLPLYFWLQSPGSVTHKERGFGFYHDNAAAGITNFRHTLEHGTLPARSYYTMVGSIHEERTAPDFHDNPTAHASDEAAMHESLLRLSLARRSVCAALRYLRLLEKAIYDRKIKNMA